MSVIRAPSASDQKWLDAHPEYPQRAAGDFEHLDDARAAYTHALLWYYTGNQAHANKAIEIMNAWSATLTKIEFEVPPPTATRSCGTTASSRSAGPGPCSPVPVRSSATAAPAGPRRHRPLREHAPPTCTCR